VTNDINRQRRRDAAHAAWFLADRHCTSNCRAYHRLAPLLGYLGLGARPTAQIDFYRRALTEALATGAKDILISGAVDPVMPDLVADIAAGFGVAVLVLDRCRTPLAVLETLPPRNDVQFRTCWADILSWQTTSRFDVITTHSLLGQIAPAQRDGLMRNWHGLLGSGGRVITVNRVRPHGENLSFDPPAQTALVEEVVRRYQDIGPFADISPAEVRNAFLSYAGKHRIEAVRSVDEIRTLFLDAGFEAVALTETRAGELTDAAAGPGIADGAVYCHIVARRAA
jgi:hypothetical protein